MLEILAENKLKMRWYVILDYWWAIISYCILISFQVIHEEEIKLDHINIESQGAYRSKIIENISMNLVKLFYVEYKWNIVIHFVT